MWSYWQHTLWLLIGAVGGHSPLLLSPSCLNPTYWQWCTWTSIFWLMLLPFSSWKSLCTILDEPGSEMRWYKFTFWGLMSQRMSPCTVWNLVEDLCWLYTNNSWGQLSDDRKVSLFRRQIPIFFSNQRSSERRVSSRPNVAQHALKTTWLTISRLAPAVRIQGWLLSQVCCFFRLCTGCDLIQQLLQQGV